MKGAFARAWEGDTPRSPWVAVLLVLLVVVVVTMPIWMIFYIMSTL